MPWSGGINMCSVRALFLHALLSVTMLALPIVAQAQAAPTAEGAPAAPPSDPFVQIVAEMNRLNGMNTLCMSPSWPMDSLKSYVVKTLIPEGQTTAQITGELVATQLWHLFPCPFSPFRPEFRAATAADVEGVWLYPEASQKLRYGPKSKVTSPFGNMNPVRCDALGLYPGGEHRQMFVTGSQTPCPFRSATDLDASRKNPRVANWAMSSSGRLQVTRTDVPDHIEEWDMFVVLTGFTYADVQFEPGDLVGYLRRAKGNDTGASQQFRHLKRLPSL